LDAPILPHMGWNTVSPGDGSMLFRGLDPSTRFYFVHSYGVHASGADADPQLGRTASLTTTEHGPAFVSAVESGVVSATQFHPEKSGDAGAALLENWLSAL
jgi:glutamine amidotransferase